MASFARALFEKIVDTLPPASDEAIPSPANDPILIATIDAPTEATPSETIQRAIATFEEIPQGEGGGAVIPGAELVNAPQVFAVEFTPEQQAENARRYEAARVAQLEHEQQLARERGHSLSVPDISDTVRGAIDTFTQAHLPHAAFLAPELLADDSVVYDIKADVRAELPKELQQVADFEEVNFNYIKDTLLENPERLLYGSADPLSTLIWNEVLGTNYAPVINQMGGPTPEAFMLAEQQGIDTSISQISHQVASAIAGAIGGGAAAEALAPLLASASSTVIGAADSLIGGAASSTSATAGTVIGEGSALLAPVIVTGSNTAALLGAGLGVGAGAAIVNAGGVLSTPEPLTDPAGALVSASDIAPVIVTGSNSVISGTVASALGAAAGGLALPDAVSPVIDSAAPSSSTESTPDEPERFSEEWWRALIEERGYPWVRAQLASLLSPQGLSAEEFDAYQAYLDDLAAREGYTSHTSILVPGLLALAGAALFMLG